MDNEKIDEVKEIVEKGQQTKDNRKPKGIRSSIPPSYLSQGNADINKSKYIKNADKGREKVLEKVWVKPEPEENRKKEKGPEMGR